jgi:hypothetical protein
LKNLALSWLLAAALLAFRCTPEVEQPSLPDDKMARIIADIALAEAATVGLGGYSRDSLQQIYYRQVLEMHGITLEEYEKNLRLYADDIPRFQNVVTRAEALIKPDSVASPLGR